MLNEANKTRCAPYRFMCPRCLLVGGLCILMHEEDYEATNEIPSIAPPAHAAVNGVPEGPSPPNENTASSTEIPPPLIPGLGTAPFFQRTDWLSFALTTGLVLAVYLFTLAPEVTL